MTSVQPVLAMVDPGAERVSVADASAAHLRVDDLSAQRGDGIFETMLVVEGLRQQEAWHFDRFVKSARALDLPEPGWQLWKSALDTVIEDFRNANPAARVFGVRYVLSRGIDGADRPHGWVSTVPIPDSYAAQADAGLAVTGLDAGFDAYLGAAAPWLLQGAKTLSYAGRMAATRYAKKGGFDEALFFSHDGLALEFPTANLIVARDRRLMTPAPEAGLLHGTTQRAIFLRARAIGWACDYVDLRRGDIEAADGAWIVSSIRTAMPVIRLDDSELAFDAELNREVRSLALEH